MINQTKLASEINELRNIFAKELKNCSPNKIGNLIYHTNLKNKALEMLNIINIQDAIIRTYEFCIEDKKNNPDRIFLEETDRIKKLKNMEEND